MANALKRHFRSAVLEKHPKVMLNELLDRAMKKSFKNYTKNRITQAALRKFLDEAVKDFRRFYGEWVNIYDFDIRTGKFRTNFQAIYKTELGRLYGSFPGSIHDHIFYTAHCFEQFRDRSDCYKAFPLLVLAYKRTRNAYPTPADILRFMILNACEYNFADNFIYVNTQNGVLVLEKLSGGIMIAKTFLLPDMTFPKKGWFYSDYGAMTIDPTDSSRKTLAEKNKVTYIEKPHFTVKECDYANYVAIMELQVRNIGLNV